MGISLGAWSQTRTNCFIAKAPAASTPLRFICVDEPVTFEDTTARSRDPLFAVFYYINNQQITLPYRFTAPGRYEVRQLANGFDQCLTTFVVRAKAPASPPVFQRLTLLPNNRLQVQVNSSAVNDLIVERVSSGTGTFTPVDTLRNVPVGSSQQTLNTSLTSGCFRLRVTNICTENETIVSATVCAQDLRVTAGNRTNQLTWTANASPGSVVNYQVHRGGQVYQTLPASQTTFTDQQVACGRRYTYQLLAVLPNNTQSASLPVEVETRGTTPPAAPLLIASFDIQNRVTLQTVVPTQETFLEQVVYRSQNGSAFNQILDKQPRNTIDATPGNLTSPFCYQVAYTDSCRLVSPSSASVCPAILSAVLQPEGGVRVSWSTYEGFPSGIGTQTLELLDEQGTVYWSLPVTGQSYIDVNPQEKYQRLTYRLVTTALNAPYQSYSNTASVDQDFQFHFPTAFTPNQDGLNDIFRPVGAPFSSRYLLQVLNRWGQIIFESKDPKTGWDGTHGGKLALPETYIYRFEALDVNGQRITRKGTFTLIR
ncbi:hypothetical protein DC20_16735 [Rufibacter tibetensis]|uniref:Fibronectin type-III domain-containing protein n=2 Tax=Rufibacter tibetensis TaxID=512763 RepID=A0A0P0C9P1_9BACT|nr:hypothetical protein DC20_16735 [Rufibacter tibetensis]